MDAARVFRFLAKLQSSTTPIAVTVVTNNTISANDSSANDASINPVTTARKPCPRSTDHSSTVNANIGSPKL
jgi:hypothetical protein